MGGFPTTFHSGGAGGVAGPFRHWKVGGQVPSRERLEMMRLTEKPAPRFNPAMLLQHTEPRMTVNSVLDGLGLDHATHNNWRKFLDKALNTDNELLMRRDVLSKMMYEKMDPALRRAIFQRSLNYYRGRFQKSHVIQVINPAELSEVERYFLSDEASLAENAREANRQTFLARNPGMSGTAAEQMIKRRLERLYERRPDLLNKAIADAYRSLNKRARVHFFYALPESDRDLLKAATNDRVERTYKVKGHVEVVGQLDRLLLLLNKLGEWGASRSVQMSMDGDGPHYLYVEGTEGKLNREQLNQVTKKDTINVFSLKLEKAEARGGNYHRRVTDKNGKHRYYYDPDKYESSKDAHLDGRSTAKKNIRKAVQKYMDDHGEKGCPIGQLKALVKRYGSEVCGEALNELKAEGGLTFKAGKLYANSR